MELGAESMASGQQCPAAPPERKATCVNYHRPKQSNIAVSDDRVPDRLSYGQMGLGTKIGATYMRVLVGRAADARLDGRPS